MTTTPDPLPLDDSGQAHLAAASAALKERVSPRAVEVADHVLATALRSGRRSHPVRALPPHDHVHVSDQVVVSRLRQRIDDGVPACAVGRIHLLVDPRAHLQAITVEVFVQYGQVLMDVADRVRERAALAIGEVLGVADPVVEVVVTHVHVGDITVGDPHLVDPSDEAPGR